MTQPRLGRKPDDFKEELFVSPCGFSFDREALLAWDGMEQAEGHVTDGCDAGRAMLGAKPHEIVVEDDVHDPVEAILDASAP